MSLTVSVFRGLGDNPGPDIVCRYFSDEAVFAQAGRVAIDRSEKGLRLVTITLSGMCAHVRPGRLVHIADVDGEYRGRVKSIQYSVGRDDSGKPFAVCSMTLRLLRVA